jgi:hypothetical protein
MHKMRLTYLVFIIVLSLKPIPLSVQPIVSGDLSGVFGPGDFIVIDDCFVPEGESLTILPGTNFLFSGHFTLFVSGTLTAEGTLNDPIRFVRQFPTEECKHGGINIQGDLSQNHSLSYCQIDYADNTEFPVCFGGGLYCEGTRISISNCTITNCNALFGGGMYIYYSIANVSDCHISGCTAIAECAALWSSFGSIIIDNCEVVGNTGDHVGGIYIFTNDYAEVNNCVVAMNTALTEAG